MAMKCPQCRSENTDTARFCSNCATALTGAADAPPAFTATLETPREEIATGTIFAGRYQIIEELGRGGMGNVYRVLDRKLNEEVALKLIKPEIASDKKTLERFKNELKLTRKVSQKNVGRMFDFGEEGGTHYITMEYVPGEDLKSSITRFGQLPIGKSIAVAKQICDGLAEAHATGIVHRDLKPSNIMIDKSGNARIMDFGIARSLKMKGLTGAGMMIGTPEYMSPEQAEAKEVDERSDIYSLGVILYEMATGKLPFEGDTPLSVAMKHKGEAPEDPRSRNPHIPLELSRLILKCMEKDKAKRIPSAKALGAALSEIEGALPTPAGKSVLKRPTGTRDVTVTFNIRKIGFTALVVVAVVLAVFAVWKLFLEKGRGSSPRISSIAVLPFADLSPEKDQEYFCDGMTEEIISKLSQITAWKVISRTSVMPYKNTTKDAKEIGGELNVETLIEGSVRKDQDNIRVTVQLIDVADDSHLWVDSYDRTLDSVFEIQSDIAENIVRELKAELSAEEEEGLLDKPTDSLEAYNFFLQGKYYLNNYSTRDSLEMSAEMFEKAVALDPDFALAYVNLVIIHATLYVPNTWDHTPERLARCKEALDKAVELAPDLPETRRAVGHYLEWIENDYTAALAEYEAALERRPNDPDLLSSIGIILLRNGEPERASKYLEESYARDPNTIDQAVWISWSYAVQRKWAEAERWIDDCISNRPEYSLGYFRKVDIYINGYGDLEGARAVIEEAYEHTEDPGLVYYKGMVELLSRNYQEAFDLYDSYAGNPAYITGLKGRILDLMGEEERANSQYETVLELLAPLIAKRPENAFYYADRGLAYAGLGNKEEALKWGEKAVDLHPPQTDPYTSGEDIYLSLAQIEIMIGEHEGAIEKLEYLLSIPSKLTRPRLRVDPAFDPLRSYSKFQKLIGDE